MCYRGRSSVSRPASQCKELAAWTRISDTTKRDAVKNDAWVASGKRRVRCKEASSADHSFRSFAPHAAPAPRHLNLCCPLVNPDGLTQLATSYSITPSRKKRKKKYTSGSEDQWAGGTAKRRGWTWARARGWSLAPTSSSNLRASRRTRSGTAANGRRGGHGAAMGRSNSRSDAYARASVEACRVREWISSFANGTRFGARGARCGCLRAHALAAQLVEHERPVIARREPGVNYVAALWALHSASGCRIIVP